MTVGLVAVFALVGFSQRAGRGPAGTQQVVVEKSDGTFARGWLKKDKGKSTFVDAKGESVELTKKDKTYTLSQMNQEFKRVRQSIMTQDLKDIERNSKIISWAKNHNLYEQVEEYAQKNIQLNPSNPDPIAEENLKWAREQLDAIKTGPSAGPGSDWTMQDVQKVRFALIPPLGKPAENMLITFKNNVVKRFFEKEGKEGKYGTKDAQREFSRKPPTEQAQIIKQETGNTYQPDINIGKEPTVMLEFKRIVQPIVTRGCSSINCHGSGHNPLKLAPRAATPPEIYANFYSLDTHRSERGTIIDHENPNQSLLLNYLLPPILASNNLTHEHEIRPLIKSKSDPRYRQLVDWIKSLPTEPIDRLANQESVTTTKPKKESGL